MKYWGYESRANGKHVLLLDFWLTIGRGEGYSARPSVRATAGYPSLGRNERAINLKMEVPIALFEAPSLSASITVESPARPRIENQKGSLCPITPTRPEISRW